MKRLVKKATAMSIGLDFFYLNSGDIIGFNCRLVNNKPWYQIYQQGQYITSSFYDGPDYDRAIKVYGEALLAFRGVSAAEKLRKSEKQFQDRINRLMINEKKEDYMFQQLKMNPLFLGVNDF